MTAALTEGDVHDVLLKVALEESPSYELCHDLRSTAFQSVLD